MHLRLLSRLSRQLLYKQGTEIYTQRQYVTIRSHNGIAASTLIQRNPSLPFAVIRCWSTTNVNVPVVDAAQIARDVIYKTSQTDVMAGSLPPKEIENLVGTLLEFGFSVEQTCEVLTGRVWLMKQERDLAYLIQVLHSHGLSPNVTLELIKFLHRTNQEGSVKQLADSIESSIALLRGMGFSDSGLRRMIEKCPDLFTVDSYEWENNWMSLQTLFSKSDARKVVEKCPNVLSDPWTTTQAKFDYANLTMGCDERQIVDSHFLSHHLTHIQDRHLFISRAGLYVHVKLKDNPALNPNPKLKDIMDVSVGKFTSGLGLLTRQQFEAFREIRVVERQMEEKERGAMEGFYSEDDEDFEVKREKHKKKKSKKKQKQ